MHDNDRLQIVVLVVLQPLLERFRRCAAPPRAGHVLHDDAQTLGDVPPGNVREPAGFEDENAIAGRERVGERRFGGTGARRGKYHDRSPRAEDALQPVEHFEAQVRELGTSMVDRGLGNLLEHTIGNVGRAGNLQEVTSSVNHGALGEPDI